jgi:hypothetical protein
MRMKLVPPNLFERFVGMGFASETTIRDGEIVSLMQLPSSGPTTHHLRERDQ